MVNQDKERLRQQFF